MKRIGIFGTTADPFTECHMAIINKVLDENLVDFVYVVPTIVDYHRAGKEKWLSNEAKFYIINRALSVDYNSNLIGVERCEWDYAHNHSPFVCSERRFAHTLNDIIWTHSHMDDEYLFSTIIGTDSLANFKTWYKWEEIVKHSNIIGVLGRSGVEVVNEELCKHIITLDEKYGSVSATEIRNCFAKKPNGFLEYEHYLVDRIMEMHK